MYQLYKGDTPLATFVPQIADNLTTDDSTKALSAKQGKVLNDKITINNAETSGFINVGGTWQIPSNVWNHTFILIEMRRQGVGGYMVFSTEHVSAFDNGMQIRAVNDQYYNFKISDTGLFTLLGKSSGINEPYIKVYGIL